MLEGMNYLHAKFQINILRYKKVIKLLELWTLWLKKKKKKKRKNSEYKRVVITTLKIANSRVLLQTPKINKLEVMNCFMCKYTCKLNEAELHWGHFSSRSLSSVVKKTFSCSRPPTDTMSPVYAKKKTIPMPF